MRDEIPGSVHDMDRGFWILYTDVNVQAEDKVGTRHLLHVFDDEEITLVGIDFLVTPIRERMGAGGGNRQTVLCGEPDDVAAKFLHLFLGLFHGVADSSANLD